VLGVIGTLVAASPLLAHHEWPVNRTKQVTVKGTVTAYTWADPHVMIALDVQANGTIEKWKVGGLSKKNMAANGWDRNTLKPGDVITGIGYRFSDGSNVAATAVSLRAGWRGPRRFVVEFRIPGVSTTRCGSRSAERRRP
jgi:hypothetical protein